MPFILLLLPLAALALYLYSSGALASIDASGGADGTGTSSDASLGADVAPYASGLLDSVNVAVQKVFNVPPAGAQYAEAIAAAETKYGLPPSLLARTIYQESRFRPEIIDGSVRSSAGAVGIAQFLPTTAAGMGVDPLDPFASIDGAARDLRAQFDRFGTWADALMSYNWGGGNTNSFKRTGKGAKGQPLPLETRNYVSQILADVSV